MRRSKARSKEAIQFAKSQRKESNEFTWIVWQWLRNRQCHGQKFRREFPIPPYTADFCCIELRLIIEIDGEPHFTEEGKIRDGLRDQFLKQLGYQILRVPGYAVIREEGDALERIHRFVKEALALVSPSPPSPLSPKRGEGEPEDD